MSDDTLPPLDNYAKLMPFISSHERKQADILCELLYEFLHPRSVIDLGCGPGTYLTPFRDRGVEILGVDAEPTAGEDLSAHEFVAMDLRLPFTPLGRFDLCLCIETAEHLQPEYADQIVAHCVSHAPVIFWSAAKPKQGGQHHHNEQPRSYWLEKFALHGYSIHPLNSLLQQAISTHPEFIRVGWLIDNSVLLERV